MSSLIGFVQDLLPMIIPTSISITRAADLDPALEFIPVKSTEPAEPAAPAVPTETAAGAPEPDQAPPETSLQPEPQEREIEPAVTSKNAIVGRSDKMCAAGEPSTALCRLP